MISALLLGNICGASSLICSGGMFNAPGMCASRYCSGASVSTTVIPFLSILDFRSLVEIMRSMEISLPSAQDNPPCTYLLARGLRTTVFVTDEGCLDRNGARGAGRGLTRTGPLERNHSKASTMSKRLRSPSDHLKCF